MKIAFPAGPGLAAALLTAVFAAPAGASLPAELAADLIRHEFDGRNDDLLSAGLGVEGLRGPAPGFADPANPTVLELRRRAIWVNYRGLADTSPDGGFGRLSGPRDGERIAGVEYLAAVKKPGKVGITTVLLQIPAHFNPARPCMVAAASSGSRGIYGALPTAGEWGLRKGCAVAYTDKGTGTGFADLDTGTVYRIDLRSTKDTGDPLVNWQLPDSAGLAEWRRTHAHRVAVKHAHGSDNPEREWGQYLLQAVKTGFMLLQREFPATDTRPAITRERTTVIASGISNGGGAVLRAIEADAEGLLDAAVVSEPSVVVPAGRGIRIEMGTRPPPANPSLALFDYALLHYLLQPAAVLVPEKASAMTEVPALQRPLWEAWAAKLAELGLVTGETLEQRARDARRQLEAAGVLREALDSGIANVSFGLWPAIGEAYASAYARLGPQESPCGLSYAATDSQFAARALTGEELARLAADSVGVPPTGGIQLVDEAGRFASLGSIEHALCLRELATGRTLSGDPLETARDELSQRLRRGIEEIRMSAHLHGKPVIIVHGRRDGLVPVNLSSRAWYALHCKQGEHSARYYEVEHGQHFDGLIALPGWDERFVPLQPQLLAAMDLMHRHLTTGGRLPPSQVVRSRPRRVIDGKPDPLGVENLGVIREKPHGDAIRFRHGALVIPE